MVALGTVTQVFMQNIKVLETYFATDFVIFLLILANHFSSAISFNVLTFIIS
jgi:hypothetical protein